MTSAFKNVVCVAIVAFVAFVFVFSSHLDAQG